MKNKIRILIIGPLPLPLNGCSLSNKILLNWFVKAKKPFSFIDTNTNQISSQQGDKFSFFKSITFFQKYIQLYKIVGSDIIYMTPGLTFYGILKYAPFILLCQIVKKKYVIHIHGNNFDSNYKIQQYIKQKIWYRLISKASQGIVLSESLLPNLTLFLPIDKISIVKNFVTDNLINSYFQPKKTDKLRILFLSNLIVEKGFVDILDALIILKEKEIRFNAIFAGKIDTQIFESVKNKFDFLKDSVSYIGIVEGNEKKNVLVESNIFILPTYYKIEGQPISILEAMATGNIIITTRQGGIEDIVSNDNGYFVDKKSPISIADTLEQINSNLQNEIDAKAFTNYKKIKNSFTEELFFNNILNIFNKL
ncbi:MAG: glycosyltransferase family 4 protein [Bacteroidota bacterium]